ncbi:MAG: glycoside hydrolase family 99-like domain-containing protein [Chloroflexi bacterium]|nr:glycoside hydrolase family 99-like domain-containing protein [Chloroflexota bacterium]
MVRRVVQWITLGLMLACWCAPSPLSAAPGRMVLAIYYPWYDQSIWKDPVVVDYPPDRYSSSNPAVIARQVDQARGAGIDGFISAWYGPRVEVNQTETNLRALLDVAAQRGFTVAAGVETGGPFFHSPDDVRNALSALLSTHATKPAYMKSNGRPVIFFTQTSLPGVGNAALAGAWQSIRNQVDPNRRSLWISEGLNMSLQGPFDGGFLYSVAWAADPGAAQRQWAGRVRDAGGTWVGTVMPGWDDTRLVERSGRYRRDRQGGEWYKGAWAGAASANPDWIVITSWNEFVENTYIEPSAKFGTQYLDLTRALAGAWKSGAPASVPGPAPAAVAPPATAAPKPPARPATPMQSAERSVDSLQRPLQAACSATRESFCLVP